LPACGPDGTLAVVLTTAVMTVRGPVDPGTLGHVQMHEHLICDLSPNTGPTGDEIRLDNFSAARIDMASGFDMRLDDPELAVRELEAYTGHGGGTIVEATSVGLGRDPAALAWIAERSSAHVVMGSGYYVGPFHPPSVATATDDDITAEIVADLTSGVGHTGIRAGVIGEIGMSAPSSPDEHKVLRAAARAQAATGAALLIHPGRSASSPFDHVEVVRAAGGDLTRTIMGHIDRTLFDVPSMVRLADTGVVLEFDLFGEETTYYPLNPDIDRPNDGARVAWIRRLVEHGYGRQIVIAQDICRKTRLLRWGGEGYAHIRQRVVPLLLARGLTADQVDTICRTRPAELLTRPV
jgi:phosphotriesterase-related protein